MPAKENNMTLPTIGDRPSGTNPKQVSNNATLDKAVIIIEKKKSNQVTKKETLRKKLSSLILQMMKWKKSKRSDMNQKLKKPVIINDISDYEVDTVYAESRKTNEELNKKETNTDSDDEQPAIFKQGNIENYIYPDTCYINKNNNEDGEASHHKQHKYTLPDEDIDKEEWNIKNYIYPNSWSNINDNDEHGEDLYDSDMFSIRSVSDGDKNDSFINDGTTYYDTTADEDSDNFF
ncbi:hypothetical protein Tco_0868317 [Tanacetum coccineum]